MTATTPRGGAPAGPRPAPGVPGAPGAPDPRTGLAPAPGGRRAARGSGRRRAAVRTAFEGTPGRLRLAGIGAVLACLVLSLLGAAAFQQRGTALADARADAAQLIRVQEIATQLVRADSLFTNGYLAYGQESGAKLDEYDKAITAASALIADASRATASDATALATVNDELTEYTARVAQARAANNQGHQVATGYLRQASVLLRGNPDAGVKGMLPTLTELMTTNGERVDEAYSSSRLATWMLVGTIVLSLGGLVAVQVWLARRTRRYLNLPLIGATAAVLAVLAAGTVFMANAQSEANRVYDTSYRALRNLAGARIDAYTAKSAESISLIYRGTGGDYPAADKQYASLLDSAANRLQGIANVMPSGTSYGGAELTAWRAAHDKLVAGADADWIKAAAAATGDNAGSVNATFVAVDTATAQALTSQASSVGAGLNTGRLALLVVGWAAVVVGILAAAASWTGITQRLEEYR